MPVLAAVVREEPPGRSRPGRRGRPTAPAGRGLGADPSSRQAASSTTRTEHFRPLEYEYNEDLLKILDQFDDHQKARPRARPRAMPKLDEEEEVAHLRETIRRWEAKSGKSLRAEVDKLKAAVAARSRARPRSTPSSTSTSPPPSTT